MILKSLSKLLEKNGAKVICCNNGKEAIKIIHNKNFNKIVCDLMLQDITGFDVIEESKKKFSLEELKQKFVIITAYSSEHVLNQARQYGCPILGKPFEDMNFAINTILS